jgi:hypothetical protein
VEVILRRKRRRKGKEREGEELVGVVCSSFQVATYYIYDIFLLQSANCNMPTCSVLPNSSFLSRDEVKMDGKND